MNCPRCGVWSRVLETRGTSRRRECANLHRFSTVEAPAEDMAAAHQAHALLGQLVGLKAHEPHRNRSNEGRWRTLNVPAELWRRAVAAMGLER